MIDYLTELFNFGKIAYVVKQFTISYLCVHCFCILQVQFYFLHKYGEIFSLKLCFQFLEFWELKLESLIACWFYDKIFFQRSHVLFLLGSEHRYLFKIQHYLLLLLM